MHGALQRAPARGHQARTSAASPACLAYQLALAACTRTPHGAPASCPALAAAMHSDVQDAGRAGREVPRVRRALSELTPCNLMRRTLGALAEKCHAYAKALHYRELEFRSNPEAAVEALISINNNLRLPEAADGILAHAQGTLHMDLKARSSGVCGTSRGAHQTAWLPAQSCRRHPGARPGHPAHGPRCVVPAACCQPCTHAQQSRDKRLNRWEEALEASARQLAGHPLPGWRRPRICCLGLLSLGNNQGLPCAGVLVREAEQVGRGAGGV